MSADGFIVANANTILDAQGTAFPYIQKHTGYPGAAGTANVAGDATRHAATWAAASGGSMVSSADLTWSSVTTAETYSHFSAWSASTAGTCGFTGLITTSAVVIGDNWVITAGNLTVSLPVAS